MFLRTQKCHQNAQPLKSNPKTVDAVEFDNDCFENFKKNLKYLAKL